MPAHTLTLVTRWISAHRRRLDQRRWQRAGTARTQAIWLRWFRDSTRVSCRAKHHRHGGNIQVLTDPTGYPVWVSRVSPGSTHDITAARKLALHALYPAAAAGVVTLTDKGYQGAGIGIWHPRRLPAQPVRGGGQILVGRDGSVLFAISALSREDMIPLWKEGRRSDRSWFDVE